MAALDKLLSWIPADTRYTCYERVTSGLPGTQTKNTLAAVSCDNPADGVDGVVYMLFPSGAKSTQVYRANLPTSVPEDEHAADDACGVRFVWNFQKKPAGNAACFVNADEGSGSGNTVMLWTADDSHIVAIASGADPATVRTWWNNASGPTETPAKITDFGSSSDSTDKVSKAAAKALLANVGPDVQGCKSGTNLVGPGDFLWGFFVWTSAAQQCTGPQDGNILLVKLNPKSVAAFEEYYTRLYVVGDETPSTPDGCAEQDLQDTNNKPVGKISCVKVGDDTYANWYNTDTGVVGSVQLNVSADDLFTYLADNQLL